jgi:acyl-CoA thioester hydrolase
MAASRSPDAFRVRIRVRGYELDAHGHVNHAVYTQYAEHARWELLRAAGVSQTELAERGLGPAILKSTIRFRRELAAGDEVDVTCAFTWRPSRLFEVVQHMCLPDGTAVADVTGTGGLIDLRTRKLVTDPGHHLRALATAPDLLGLDGG